MREHHCGIRLFVGILKCFNRDRFGYEHIVGTRKHFGLASTSYRCQPAEYSRSQKLLLRITNMRNHSLNDEVEVLVLD